ncbi:MAG: methyltransferase domain-containing protein [Alphaproteobacteria bacterium]|nr:methyltransferase domain-containing protein [Alphaproteobacteria bacterium]
MNEPQGKALFQEIGYEAGFHREQAPTHLDFALRLHGAAGPSPAEPYHYLELGCGQGTTVAMLAAANPDCRFVANDINPEHVRNLRALAADGGLANLTVIEAGFAALATAALPPFDVITMHGVWSWVGETNRREILALVAARLKPGGIAYVSYNALPGWSVAAPLQRLLERHVAAESGAIETRIGRAVALMETLRGSGAHYFSANQPASRWLDSLAGKDTGYIVHEYLARNFAAFYAPDVHAAMAEAGLSFAGTAHIIETSEENGMPAAVPGRSPPRRTARFGR